MKYNIPKVVDKKYLMAAIFKYSQLPEQSLQSEESCKLRRILYAYTTEEMINVVARKYSAIYMNAVKQYMINNGLREVKDLLAFFGDKSYGAEFFPDFISFVIKYVMDALSINSTPKIQFVKSGELFAKYAKNSKDKSMRFIEEAGAAYYDSDVNTIYFKEDKITDFDTFMNNLAHEISHSIDTLDATKGVFGDKTIQKWCDALYTTDGDEYKYNAEEKAAGRIGVVIGKDFTRKLTESWNQDRVKSFMNFQDVR